MYSEFQLNALVPISMFVLCAKYSILIIKSILLSISSLCAKKLVNLFIFHHCFFGILIFVLIKQLIQFYFHLCSISFVIHFSIQIMCFVSVFFQILLFRRGHALIKMHQLAFICSYFKMRLHKILSLFLEFTINH